MSKVTLLTICVLLCACSGIKRQAKNVPSSEIVIIKEISEKAIIPEPILVNERFKSLYDSRQIDYNFYSPSIIREEAPLVILLGEAETFPKKLPDLGAYFLRIPSRPFMSFQLLAEGDFWAILEDAKSKHSEIRYSPQYLVGVDETADAALLFANHYAGLFQGVAFSGGRLGMNLPNLDHLPVVHFSNPDHATRSPWGGDHLIDRLQSRNNPYALAVNGNLTVGINELLAIPLDHEHLLPPYTFEDYRYSQVRPWLRVLSKYSERDPATIAGFLHDDELILEAPNVSGIEILMNTDLGFNSQTKRVRLNHRLFTLKDHDKKTVKIFENGDPLILHDKANDPSGFVNFFRNEKLIIVYQTKGEWEDFLIETQSLATELAKMEFFGFPNLNVTLKMIPLEDYNPNELESHRAIIIGDHQAVTSTIPMLKEDELTVFSTKTSAFGLITPPAGSSPLKLALLLGAHDTKGLAILQEHYTSATSLYEEADLIVWLKHDNEYLRAHEETYSSHWTLSDPSSLIITTPQQRNIVWERYLQELLIEESGIRRYALTPFISSPLSIPTRLTYESLSRVIPEKHFAQVTLHGLTGNIVGNKLLLAMDEPHILGLNDYIDFNIETHLPHFILNKDETTKRLTLLVDSSALDDLTLEELKMIDYQILPYSLREMVLQKITSNKKDFGKDFLRLANLVEDE